MTALDTPAARQDAPTPSHELAPPEVSTPQAEVRRSTTTWTAGDTGLVLGSAASSLALVWLVYGRFTPFSGLLGFLLLWYACFLGVYWSVVREVHGALPARDRLAGAVVLTGAAAVLVPLALLLSFVVRKGIGHLHPGFFTHDSSRVGPLDSLRKGGASQAIVGTLEQVGLAVVLSVPLGVLTAVFLNEVKGPLRRPVRTFVDAMSGVPSIVAGLFIYAVWILALGQSFSGLAAALAISILMLPTITRTSEEVLRLVPSGLREAALALGAPEWRTTWSVVLPTARAGLITAVVLGIARGVGETAPLILTAGGSKFWNANPVSGAQDALPLYIYNLVRSPQNTDVSRAYMGALVLIIVVLILFVTARILGARQPGRGRRPRARHSRKDFS